MIKTLSAVAISAFIAAAFFVLSGYAPEVGPGQLAALQKSSRRDMKHNDQIILPYAVSDTFSNFATIKISALMQAMKA